MARCPDLPRIGIRSDWNGPGLAELAGLASKLTSSQQAPPICSAALARNAASNHRGFQRASRPRSFSDCRGPAMLGAATTAAWQSKMSGIPSSGGIRESKAARRSRSRRTWLAIDRLAGRGPSIDRLAIRRLLMNEFAVAGLGIRGDLSRQFLRRVRGCLPAAGRGKQSIHLGKPGRPVRGQCPLHSSSVRGSYCSEDMAKTL
jgi:hypothetical protein